MTCDQQMFPAYWLLSMVGRQTLEPEHRGRPQHDSTPKEPSSYIKPSLLLKSLNVRECSLSSPSLRLLTQKASYLPILGALVDDPSLYRSTAGALEYLTFTRPNLTYAFQQLFIHLHCPRTTHLTALKRVLHFLHGTVTHEITLSRSTTDSLQDCSDVDWAGDYKPPPIADRRLEVGTHDDDENPQGPNYSNNQFDTSHSCTRSPESRPKIGS
ncbi:unnamed protein product [Cuscuta campestris]|uniref:Reverse transcriptase Ty1/copia-type domain-containing protein n=1 Tax=Cuscuta campestris TaxID=132261 RepID=A0A484MIT9_9ASTE|nr:unnamed protein product [Cuscuta campestris]